MNIWYVLVACLLLSVSCAITGTWLLLRRESLTSDVVSHGVLPGVCLSFMWYSEKNTWILSIGALISSLACLLLLNFLKKYSKLSSDTLMAMILTFFFAVGIWLIVKIQTSGNASQSGLEHFIFGKTASILPQDIYLIVSTTLIVFLISYFYKRLINWSSFDRQYSKSIGLSTKVVQNLLITMSILTITAGLQAVGSVLISSMLITPVLAARYISKTISQTMLWAMVLNITAVVLGIVFSYSFPKTPTGPWIVVVVSVLAFSIFLFKKVRVKAW